MTLNQLYHFLSVVRNSSITKAASKLYVSHSSISRSISELESEFKISLFVRDGHNLILTEEGFLFAEHCKKIEEDIESLKRDMDSIASKKVRSLRVSLPSLDIKSDIFVAINRFRSEYPEVSLAFEDLDHDQIEDDMTNNKLDLVITYSFVIEEMNLPCYKYATYNLFQEELCAIVNNNSPEAKMETLDIHSNKMKHPLTLKNATSHFVESSVPSSLFKEHSNPQHYQPLSLNSIILSVINGTGWACLPECIAYRFASFCTILPLRGADTKHYVSMCWRTEPKNPMLNKLVQTIIRQFEQE